QIGIYLDPRMIAALVPVVAAPRLVGDQGEVEALPFRQLDMPQRAAATFGNARIHDALEPVVGNVEPAVERVESLPQRPLSRHQRVDARYERVEGGELGQLG